MAGIARFEDIEAWQTARLLTRLIYKYSDHGVFSKDFGLKDQIRRASVSVMSNIAEGFESRTDTQFINFLGHARGSAGEVRSQLYVALDMSYISEQEFAEVSDLADKASRQIRRFMDYLEKNPRNKRVGEDPAEYSTDV